MSAKRRLASKWHCGRGHEHTTHAEAEACIAANQRQALLWEMPDGWYYVLRENEIPMGPNRSEADAIAAAEVD